MKSNHKVLEYVSLIRPGGGPPGYVYNLRNALNQKYVNHHYLFCSFEQQESRKVILNKRTFYQNLKSLLFSYPFLYKNRIISTVLIHISIRKTLFYKNKNVKKLIAVLKENPNIKAVHFHDPFELYFFSKTLTARFFVYPNDLLVIHYK